MDAATRAKQSPANPSNYTPGSGPGVVFTLTAGEYGFVQNLSTSPLAISLGGTASPSAFSFVLPACTASDDGTSAAAIIDDFIGPVSVAAVTGSENFIAWKRFQS